MEMKQCRARDDSGHPESMRLERWRGDAGECSYPDGVELFVIDGSCSDETGT